MMRKATVLLIALLLVASAAEPSFATRVNKAAVVLTNEHYGGEDLSGVLAGGQQMTAALQSLGFDPVLTVTDGDKLAMKAAIDSLARLDVRGGTLVVYYAGHSVQVNGQNYFIPTDAKWDNVDAIQAVAPSMDDVFDAIRQTGAAQNFVFVDACRDNRFAAVAGTDYNPGLAAPQNPPKSTLISYAAPPNQTTAGDVIGSYYTRLLAKFILEPGLSATDLLARINARITDISPFPDKVPWSTGSLPLTYYFRDPVFVTVQVSRADDVVVVSFGDQEVADSGTKGFMMLPHALKVGENRFTVRVYNQKSFTPIIRGHQPEGWNYTVDIRTTGGATLAHLEDGEDSPAVDGPRFGAWFIVATGILTVNPQSAAVYVTLLDAHAWTHPVLGSLPRRALVSAKAGHSQRKAL